jgi:hypothetical protein
MSIEVHFNGSMTAGTEPNATHVQGLGGRGRRPPGRARRKVQPERHLGTSDRFVWPDRRAVLRRHRGNDEALKTMHACRRSLGVDRSALPCMLMPERRPIDPFCVNAAGARSHSRGMRCPSFAATCPSKTKGRRECRALAATHGPPAEKKQAAVTTGPAEHPAFPARWAYGLYVISSVHRACWPPSSH